MADSPTQQQWDLRLMSSEDGTVVSSLQLKTTESLAYAKRAAAQGTQVLGTEEVASVEGVLNSGIKSADLEAEVRAPLEDALDTPLEELVETVLPGLPFVLIPTMEGSKVLMGQQSIRQAVDNIAARGLKTGAAMGVGALAAHLSGLGVVTLPATAATRLGIDRFVIYSGLSKRLNADIRLLKLLEGSTP